MTSPRVRRQHDSSTRHNGFVCLPARRRPRGVGSSCFGLFFLTHSLSVCLSVSPSLLSTFPSHIIRHAFPVATRAVPFHRRRCGLVEHGWGRWQLSKRLTCILCFPFLSGADGLWGRKELAVEVESYHV